MIAQVLSVLIFLIMFLFIISEKVERHIVTLVSGLVTCIVIFGICMKDAAAFWRTLNISDIFTISFWYSAGEASESSSGINWATIIFILGMMIMVEGMARVGFFHWLCMKIAHLVDYKPIPIFITFMIMSALLTMFIDSITVILFLAAVTVELGRQLKFDLVPLILSEIFCANLGGSATMCGDPPNIIIGTSLGFTFFDFITNTGLMAGVSLIFVVIYFYLVFHKEIQQSIVEGGAKPSAAHEKVVIEDKKGFTISSLIFLCAVVMLITHSITGLTVAFIGVFISLITLLTSGKYAVDILKKVDYKTLLFFVGLFVVVGGLEETGILEVVAAFIEKISGGNLRLMIVIIIWVSAVASAFVDNIPFAATMIPIIRTLAESSGVSLPVLAWALSMGTDIGGSATPIGASANVVGISVASKNGHPIGWGRYCVKVAPATLLVCLVSTLMMFLRYC
ncbi:MAG: citrate transporter [Clostridiales bacterium]|nr:citrate transporter [Clostridiales bacterium]